MPGAAPSGADQSCVQILLNVPRWAKFLPAENHCLNLYLYSLCGKLAREVELRGEQVYEQRDYHEPIVVIQGRKNDSVVEQQTLREGVAYRIYFG